MLEVCESLRNAFFDYRLEPLQKSSIGNMRKYVWDASFKGFIISISRNELFTPLENISHLTNGGFGVI